MNLKISLVASFLVVTTMLAKGQNSVGIGVVNPNKNAVLELVSPGNNQGLLVPRLTTAQRTAAAFTSSLKNSESGLLVFDSTDGQFYYWQTDKWVALQIGAGIVAGAGISLTGNTISVIPDGDGSATNEIQDLQLVGNILTITNNASPTSINLTPFTGADTDDQVLSYDGATGVLSISGLSGGNTATITPAGTAGGDLTGSFPNPAINTNAVTSEKIADGTISGIDIANGSVTAAKLVNTGVTNGTYGDATHVAQITVDEQGRITSANDVTISGVAPGGAAGGDLTGTYPNPTLAAGSGTSLVSAINNAATVGEINTNRLNSSVVLDTESPVGGSIAGTFSTGLTINNNAVTTAKIAPGTNGQFLSTVAGATTWTTPSFGTVTSIATGTGLSGGPITTTGTLSLANTTVTAASYGSATQVPSFTVDAQGRLTAAANTTISGTAPGGTAGGALSGTYPNPTLANNAVTTAKIADGTILPADIDATAGSNGQILTISGASVAWAAPGGTVLIQAPGTRNLFAGSPIGTTTTGTDNAFYGSSAGSANTSGNYNVIVGTQAGQNKTVGDLNTLVGWLAGRATGSGAAFNGNTFLGAQAGQSATGGPNTFIGEKSGQATTTGTENLFAGNQAGITNTNGGKNTILGYQADVSSGGLQNATAIGYQASVDASNKVRIGNSSVTVIQGEVAFSFSSDKRLKYDINNIDAGLDLILKLKPVSYRMKKLTDPRLNWGFLAQDIEDLVGSDNAILTVGADKDRTLGLRYTDLIAPLVKSVQEQQQEIEQLKAQLLAKENQINALESSVKELKSEKLEMSQMKAELEKIKKVLGLEASLKK